MLVRDYAQEDLYYINLWLSQRDQAPVIVAELPEHGWTIEDEGRPVGIVFLRMVEGDLAIIDSMINDPNQSSKKRHQIQDRIFLQCMKVAKERGLRGLMGTSLDDGTLKRSYTHGFTPSPQTFVTWSTPNEVKT